MVLEISVHVLGFSDPESTVRQNIPAVGEGGEDAGRTKKNWDRKRPLRTQSDVLLSARQTSEVPRVFQNSVVQAPSLQHWITGYTPYSNRNILPRTTLNEQLWADDRGE